MHTQLSQFLNRQLILEGQALMLIEILPSEGLFVLQEIGDRPEYHSDQFGEIYRGSAKTYSLPLYDETREDRLHPILRQLFSGEELAQLHKCLC